jgi:hypothetical protein
VDVQPGRHTVVLTPSAVADLSVDLLWSSGARDAAEGRTALHDPHRPSSTKVGELICDPRVTLASNPRASSPSMMACTPFALTPVSSRYASVLDNGRDLGAQVWIDHGQLRCLQGERHAPQPFPLTGAPQTMQQHHKGPGPLARQGYIQQAQQPIPPR